VLTGPRRQLRLLDRSPSFRALFLATTVSTLPTWLAVIALTVDVYDRTHSPEWVSALLVADFLPAVVIGLAFGPVLDRFSRRRLMVASDLVSVCAFVALLFVDAPGQIVALAAVAGFATGFFRPATYAGLPNLVDEADLTAANSLLRSTANLTMVFGTLLGGVVVAASGPHLCYAVNAVSFAVSALLLTSIPAGRLDATEERLERQGYLHELKEGFSLVLRTRPLLAVFVSWNLIMLANACVNVSEIVLAKVTFDAGSFGYGLLWAGSGVGMVLGSLYAASWLEHRGVSFVYAAALGLMAFGSLAAALSPNVWVGTAGMALGGSGNGAAIVCNSLIVQGAAPDHLRGRAFTTIMSVNFALLGAGMAVAGPVTEAVGPRWTFALAALLAGIAALVGRVLTRGLGRLGATEQTVQPASASAPS
jgi:MFS family permease